MAVRQVFGFVPAATQKSEYRCLPLNVFVLSRHVTVLAILYISFNTQNDQYLSIIIIHNASSCSS